MYYKFSGFTQKLAGAWASDAYSPQVRVAPLVFRRGAWRPDLRADSHGVRAGEACARSCVGFARNLVVPLRSGSSRVSALRVVWLFVWQGRLLTPCRVQGDPQGRCSSLVRDSWGRERVADPAESTLLPSRSCRRSSSGPASFCPVPLSLPGMQCPLRARLEPGQPGSVRAGRGSQASEGAWELARRERSASHLKSGGSACSSLRSIRV